MTLRPTSLPRLGWQIAAAALIVLALLSLSIPAVRASISAWLGLSIAPSDQMPAPTANLVPIATATPTNTPDASTPQTTSEPAAAATSAPAAQNNRPAEMSNLDDQAGWEVLAPAHLPDGYQIHSTYFDTNQHMVIVSYNATRQLPGTTDPALTETKTITFIQALRNDFVPLQTAPSAAFTDIQVGQQPAAYAVGAWDTSFVKDENDPSGGKMVSSWREDLPVQNLYGQVGPVFYVLITDDTAVSQQDLINMAASLNGW